jgi:hypothetical protein
MASKLQPRKQCSRIYPSSNCRRLKLGLRSSWAGQHALQLSEDPDWRPQRVEQLAKCDAHLGGIT